jgi:cell division protease FtsH
VVDRPSIDGRLGILRVHAKFISLAEDIDLEVIARRTPGMVGADLAKVVNEAALAAAREHSNEVHQRHFEESVDRIQLGLKKTGRAMTEEEKRRVAYHESGHALVAMSVEHADPVHRVTIIPRTIGALGATLQLPTEERYLMLKEEIVDQISVMLGGRAAEEVALGTVSTGAQNDLERATETARQMVCRFGMSEKLGAQTFGRPVGARFLDSPVMFGEERNFSEHTAKLIDEEVRQIVESQHLRARQILSRKRAVLEAMVTRLLEHETLDGNDLMQLEAETDKKANEQRSELPHHPATS